MRKISAISILSAGLLIAALAAFVYLTILRPMAGADTTPMPPTAAASPTPIATDVPLTAESEIAATSVATDNPTPTPIASTIRFVLTNQTGVIICHAYLAEAGSGDWGVDRWSEFVESEWPNSTAEIAPGVYDIKLESCAGDVLHYAYGIDLTDDPTYYDANSPTGLLIYNESPLDLCGLYIVEDSEAGWGYNLLSENAAVLAGAERYIGIEGGLRDMRVTACSGEVIEIDQANLNEIEMYWTILSADEYRFDHVTYECAEVGHTRNLDLWAVYPDGRVRFATLQMSDERFLDYYQDVRTLAGPLLIDEFSLISLEGIGGSEQTVEMLPAPGADSELIYPLVTITRAVNGEAYGLDVMTRNTPYIISAAQAGADAPPDTQIFSLGIKERDYCENIVAIAFPSDVDVEIQTGSNNIDSYRSVTIGAWQVFYLNVTKHGTDSAIRVHYIPGTLDPTLLDVFAVDSGR